MTLWRTPNHFRTSMRFHKAWTAAQPSADDHHTTTQQQEKANDRDGPVQKRIVVTGGAGFLGSFVVDALTARGCQNVFVPRSREYDLVDMSAVRRLLDDARPDVIIHLAARVGGILANQQNPGRFFTTT